MESNKHHTLVKKIYEYVSSLEKIENKLIQSDIYEISGNVTRTPEGYVPDLYYSFKDKFIIGEAKTDEDLEREHSLLQYKSYFDLIKEKNKRGFNCIFVIAVPWQTAKAAIRICNRLSENIRVKIVVINELGVYKEYEKNNFK